MDEQLEYECPECGAYFQAGANRCPGCGAEFDWGDETVEEPREEIPSEPTAPKGEAEVEKEEPPEEAPLEEPEEEVPEEEAEAPEEMEKVPPEEVLEEIPPVEPRGPRLYGGLFSLFGLAFVVLTIVAFIATVLALRWDTWVNGATEETIGDHQRLYIYLGASGIVVCAIVSVVDIFRSRKGHRG